MDKMRWGIVGLCAAPLLIVAVAVLAIDTAGAPPQPLSGGALAEYSGAVPAAALLRVPVTGVYPGGMPVGLNANMKNPLSDDPDAVQRGMRDFSTFNCSGCHADNGGGGMGPSLSNDKWIYRSSPANIYLSIVQGRSAGMPAFGAMLPDRTVWELVAYIQSIAEKPSGKFGKTTSLSPQSPAVEQIPANDLQTSDPWNYTEPLPEGGAKPGSQSQ